MSHLEDLIAEYYDWQGYVVKRNIRVGKLAHGGWEMELDIVAHHPLTKHLVHPNTRDSLVGAKIKSVDELVSEIRSKVKEEGIVAKKAIPEQYPLLRTVQMFHNGYYKVIT